MTGIMVQEALNTYSVHQFQSYHQPGTSGADTCFDRDGHIHTQPRGGYVKCQHWNDLAAIVENFLKSMGSSLLDAKLEAYGEGITSATFLHILPACSMTG